MTTTGPKSLFCALLLSAAQPTFARQPMSVVLVHGAWVDGSGWRAVHDILQRDGYEVLIVQEPTLTLERDVAATRRVITQAHHAIVLVGQSYGGAVITEAGEDPKLKSLGYVAAFAPDQGESVHDLVTRPEPPGTPEAPTLPSVDGLVTLDRAKMPAAFAGDADPAEARFLADSQQAWGVAAVSAKVTQTAWRSKPVYYLVTTNDHIIPPPEQLRMAHRAHAKSTEEPSSHAVMLSHPDTVAKFIETAAQGDNLQLGL